MNLIPVLYTANLRSDLALLPRVATQLKHIRQQYGVNPPPILMLDLGNAWSDEQWVSQITEHRAPYIILDAMGYTAIYADGLDIGGILGLQEVVQAHLMNATMTYHWKKRDMSLYIGNQGPLPRISWSPQPVSEHLYEHTSQHLTLYTPLQGIGHLEIEYPSLNVQTANYVPFDPQARPDPTIVATIDYVIGEARAYFRKQQKEN